MRERVGGMVGEFVGDWDVEAETHCRAVLPHDTIVGGATDIGQASTQDTLPAVVVCHEHATPPAVVVVLVVVVVVLIAIHAAHVVAVAQREAVHVLEHEADDAGHVLTHEALPAKLTVQKHAVVLLALQEEQLE